MQAPPDATERVCWGVLRHSYGLIADAIHEVAQRFPILPPLAWACLGLASLSFWVGAFVDKWLPSKMTRDATLPRKAWVLFGIASLLMLMQGIAAVILLFEQNGPDQLTGPITLAPRPLWAPLYSIPMPSSALGWIFETWETVNSWLGAWTWLCALINIAGFYRLRRRIRDDATYSLPVPQWDIAKLTAYRNAFRFKFVAGYRRWRESFSGRRAFLSCAVLWVALAFLLQRPSIILWLVSATAVAVFLMNWIFPGIRNVRWLLLGSLCIITLWQWVGSLRRDTQLYDLVAFSLAVGVSVVLPRLVAKFQLWRGIAPRGAHPRQFWRFVVLLALTWLFASFGDWLASGTPARVNPARFTDLAKKSIYPQKRVGVALSGGGYRAALVHAGALSALERLNIPVTNMSTVSGGSIFGSFYALGGHPADFLRLSSSQELNLRRDAIDVQNVVRLALPLEIPATDVKLLPINYAFTRTDLHSRFLSHTLLSDQTLNAVGRGAAPELMICATDLQTGQAVGVARNFVLTRFMLNPYSNQVFENPQKLLAKAEALGMDLKSYGPAIQEIDNSSQAIAPLVAASAAFPGVFPPKRLSFEERTYDLSDGGLTDNTGLILLLDAARYAENQQAAGWKLDLTISIDAGAYYRSNAKARPTDASSGSTLQRAYDVMQGQVGRALPDNLQQSSPKRILLSPSLYLENRQQETPFLQLQRQLIGRSGREGDIHFMRLSDRENLRLLILVAASVLNSDRHALSILDDVYETLPMELAENRRWNFNDDSAQLRIAPIAPPAESLWSTDPSFIDALRDTLEAHRPLKPMQDSLLDFLNDRGATMESIAKIVIDDFARCLKAFADTSTLEATIPPERANRLFRLGQYLVLFNAAEIRTALGIPPNEKHLISSALIEDKWLRPHTASRDTKEVWGDATASLGKLWFYRPILTPLQQSFILCRLKIPPYQDANEEFEMEDSCRRRFATPGEIAAGEDPF